MSEPVALVIDTPGGGRVEVLASLPPGATCAQFAAALAGREALGPASDGARWTLFNHRTGEWLAPSLTAARAGLLEGDSLALRLLDEEEAPPDGTVPGSGDAAGAAGSSLVLFNRPPRVIVQAGEERHELGAPPEEPRRPRLPLAAALLPLLLGGVLYMVARSPMTLVFLAMSPLLAVGSYVESRLGARGDYRSARVEFLRAVDQLATLLEEKTGEEFGARHASAPGLHKLAVAAHARESWLWERRPQDEDFLRLRVGIGESPSRHTVTLLPGGSPGLRRDAEARLAGFDTIADVPVTVDLADGGPVGLVGDRERVLDLARWMIVQAATLHSPRNLAICAALPPADIAEWDWLKWLPHTVAGPPDLEGPALASGHAAARDLLERLLGLVQARSADLGPFRGTASRAPHPYVLVLLHEDLPLSRQAVLRLLAEGPRVGVVTVWVGGTTRDLPNECQLVIEVDRPAVVTVTIPATGNLRRGGQASDAASEAEARQVALELAPLRDASAADSRSGLPASVGLLELLGLPARPRGADIAGLRSSLTSSLAAPMGVTMAGPWVVDLGLDGPHGLVAGTTGAGKSELLQTLVGALAASHPASRLTFLLVDYKGGAAFKEAVNLPHAVGLVTDLDQHLAERALVSLRAELRRRERLFRDAGARDIAEMEVRSPNLVPPRLLIVVDEFASLAREVPDFVEGMVDLAQRGRSLGLHLLLATQRPAGVIKQNIRANTNLRICLRVGDEAESLDVVGVPDAARIARTRPGRAFARTGHNELVEVQVAFAGNVAAGASPEVAGITITPFEAGGAPAPRPPRAEIGTTDLAALVAAATEAHSLSGEPAAPRPWLPELPAVLPASLLQPSTGPGVPLGRCDLPAQQVQETWQLDLRSAGNLLVLGTVGSGKTTLLRTLAHGLAATTDPTTLHLYALDGAGGDLAPVSGLPHCGAYIRVDETERVCRLLRWLRELVDSRRAGTSATRVAVVVMVDSYAGFFSAMEKVDLGEHVDALPRLVADGPSAGVHFVVTAERRAAVPGALVALVENRLVLRQVDDDEYRNAGLPPGVAAGSRLPPGRGFLDKGVEVQCAVLGSSGSEPEQAAALGALAASASAPGHGGPARIEVLPAHVPAAELPPPTAPWRAVVGLDDASVMPVEADLSEDGLVVAGPPRSGRSTTLVSAVVSMRQSLPAHRSYLLAPRKSPLLGVGGWSEVARGRAQCQELAARLAAEVLGSPMEHADASVLVVVDDGEEVLEGQVAGDLEVLARRGRDLGFRLLAAVETRAAHRAYGGWVAEMRKGRSGLLLQPDVDIDGDLLSVRLARRGNRTVPPGRGFLVQRGVAALVQVADAAAT